MKKIITLLIAGITAGAAWCCVPPPNIEGVAFTSEETIDLTKLAALGVNGTHFSRDSSDAGIAIRYRSHYSNDAMVFVGSYGLAYQQSTTLNCMGIIADTDKYGSGSINKSVFDFANAVKVELIWMSEMGIISIDNKTITAIFDSLDKSTNGSVQYWTLQKHVLGYNSWYIKDTQSGVWGTDGVNSVRSVKEVSGCAGINAEYRAFTQSPGEVPVQNMYTRFSHSFRIIKNTGISFTISMCENVDKISMIDASGKICPVQTGTVSDGIAVSFNQHISPGIYFLRLSRNASVQFIPVMIGR